MAVGKNIKRKRGKGKQYHLPFNIKSVGKNIKFERGDLNESFGEEIKIKKGRWEEYQVAGTFLHSLGTCQLDIGHWTLSNINREIVAGIPNKSRFITG